MDLNQRIQKELRDFGVTREDCFEAIRIRPNEVPPRQLQAVEQRLKGKDFDKVGETMGITQSRARDAYRSGLRNIRIWKNS